MKKGRSGASKKVCHLRLTLDEESTSILAEAAELRRISISDYVRTIVVPQARREVRLARDAVICLSPEEQRAFWQVLHTPPKLTVAQKRLGRLMRGKS